MSRQNVIVDSSTGVRNTISSAIYNNTFLNNNRSVESVNNIVYPKGGTSQTRGNWYYWAGK